jgi:hypothetical protein
MTTKAHQGSCHCGAIRFTITIDPAQGGKCNCSVCTKLNVTSAIAKPADLVVHSDEGQHGVYEWGAKISRRYFCKQCGTHCYGRGHLAELGGDYVSVNLNCLDDFDPGQLPLVYWDGRHNNWEAGPRSRPWPIG